MDTRCRRPSASVRGRAWTRRRSTAATTIRFEHTLRTLSTRLFGGHRRRTLRATGGTALCLFVSSLTTYRCDHLARADRTGPPTSATFLERRSPRDELDLSRRTGASSAYVQRGRGCRDSWDLAHYCVSVREDEEAAVAALSRAHRHLGRRDRCASRGPGKFSTVTLRR